MKAILKRIIVFNLRYPWAANCIWGPRFQVPQMKKKHNPQIVLPKYNSIWFEGQTTRWGEKYIQTDQI